MLMSQGKTSYVLQSSPQLGAYLRSLRKTRRLTQRELGRQIGVSGARISGIERDPSGLGLTQLLKLLHVLGARLVIDIGETNRVPRSRAVMPTGEW